MAHPKRNHSKTRRDKRRTHYKAVAPALGVCSNCGATIKLHTVCGEVDGMAIRVPTPDVSVVELVVNLERDATVDGINEAMKNAASRTFGYNDKPLVSIDFTHDAHSSIFDAGQTKVLGDRLVHVTAWYDNEWGFSNRMSDTAVAMGKLI